MGWMANKAAWISFLYSRFKKQGELRFYNFPDAVTLGCHFLWPVPLIAYSCLLGLSIYSSFKNLFMEEAIVQTKVLQKTRENMLAYFATHDVKYVAEDGVFKNMTTGEVHKGKAEIGAMLHYIYHVAFDAKAEFTNHLITEDKAVVEGVFKGKHIGEFAGMAATNKEVNAPLCVTYDLKDGLIKEARIYLLGNVMMEQLGVTGASKQKTTYLVRDIFQLKFGQYKPAKKLLEEALEKELMPNAKQARVLTDFTGEAYRLIFEEGFDSLSDYENSLTGGMKAAEWQSWYERFKPLVESSRREILKQVI